MGLGRRLRTASAAACLAIAMVLPQAGPAAAQLTREVVTVTVRPGVTVTYREIKNPGKPGPVVILFAGGNGVLNLQPSGEVGTDLALNFLIRSQEIFAHAGLVTAAVDVASDQRGGLDGDIRLSDQHAQDIAKIIASLRSRNAGPVLLAGTSSGALSAVGVAARLAQSQSGPDGIILVNAQTTPALGLCGRTVYFAELAAIRVPVLAVTHRQDRCPCSPGGAVAGHRLTSALTSATSKEHRIFSGGHPPASKAPCFERTAHGFLGIESRVVTSIAEWTTRF